MKRIKIILGLQLIISTNFAQKDFGDEYPVDTITFEESCAFLKTDTSATNIWQIGKPQKIFFNSSFSVPNAIITDTINNYPVNNYSYFDLIIDENSFQYYDGQMCFEIKHKIDTDTLNDGGYITISYDKGESWYNIIEDSTQNYSISPWSFWGDTVFNNNLYSKNDTLYTGEYGFSGKSDWMTTRFSWSYILVKKGERKDISDTVIIRFNFISDDIDNGKEGWMIDDIRLFNIDMGSNIETLSKSKHAFIKTNPVKDKTEIKFDKTYNNVVLEVYDINGQKLRKECIRNQNKYTFLKKNAKNGFYFIRLIFDNKFSETYKLIFSDL